MADAVENVVSEQARKPDVDRPTPVIDALVANWPRCGHCNTCMRQPLVGPPVCSRCGR